MMRKKKVYLSLTPSERRLVLIALIYFRNEVAAKGIDTVDIDDLIKKLSH